MLLQILHKVQFIKRSNNLATIARLDSVEQDFVEIQRFEDVDLQLSSLLVRQLFPSFSKNYSVAAECCSRSTRFGGRISVSVSVSEVFFFLLLILTVFFYGFWADNSRHLFSRGRSAQ